MTQPAQTQVPADFPVKLEIYAQEYVLILNALDELPGKISRALFQKLEVQGQLQFTAALQQPAPETGDESKKEGE